MRRAKKTVLAAEKAKAIMREKDYKALVKSIEKHKKKQKK